VSNSGGAQMPAGLPVAFYLGNPQAGGTLIGTAVTTRALNLGESEDVTVTWDWDTPGDHTITIVVNDDGSGSGPVALCGAPPTVQQTVSILDVPLVESWNLISSYVNPFNTDVKVVQRPISEQFVVIQGFDEEGAKSYWPDLPPPVNTLTDVDGEHGYWIKAVSSDQLSVNSEQLPVLSPVEGSVHSGQSADRAAEQAVATLRVVGTKSGEDRPLNLAAGWNLVSYLSRRPLPVTEALQSIDGLYTAVLGFDQGALSYYPHLGPEFNTLTTLKSLYGYWIKMDQPATLQYPVTGGGLTTVEEHAAVGRRPSAVASEASRAAGVTPTQTWVNLYGPAHLPDGTLLPVGTIVQALDPTGVVCGAAVAMYEGRYGLLACYGDDPTTPEDEGARPGDPIRLMVDGQELGTAVWTAHGDRHWAPLGPTPLWQVWLPVISR
ncbi:MAG: hypothetical protein ACE5LU_29480, partial [Anaerolineae bacterium]